jgi:uncharacterized RDD family membrane protein YckC
MVRNMDTNPYQPPQSDLSTSSSDAGLASPWIRLASAIIDGLVLLPINFVIQKVFIKMPDPAEIIAAAQKGVPFDYQSLMPGRGILLIVNLLGLIALIAVNFNLLKKGQTVGKMLLKLQIQRRTDGSLLPFQEIILKRILPVYGVVTLANVIHPFVGVLGAIFVIIDALCIFRPNRNTIHDDIAGSKVVVLRG